jgi:hypothetical protein
VRIVTVSNPDDHKIVASVIAGSWFAGPGACTHGSDDGRIFEPRQRSTRSLAARRPGGAKPVQPRPLPDHNAEREADRRPAGCASLLPQKATCWRLEQLALTGPLGHEVRKLEVVVDEIGNTAVLKEPEPITRPVNV